MLAYRLGYNSDPLHGEKEMSPRHLSLWFCPQETWDKNLGAKEVTIFEARAPEQHINDQIDGTEGSSDYQNLFRLAFDCETEQLVLHLANGAIEHTTDVASTSYPDKQVKIAHQDYSDENIRWDERTLGTEASGADTPSLLPIHLMMRNSAIR